MLILVAERAGEGCVVEIAHPNATVAGGERGRYVLYRAFFDEPLVGWSTETTPAETNFKTVATSHCRQITTDAQT